MSDVMLHMAIYRVTNIIEYYRVTKLFSFFYTEKDIHFLKAFYNKI